MNFLIEILFRAAKIALIPILGMAYLVYPELGDVIKFLVLLVISNALILGIAVLLFFLKLHDSGN